MSYHHEEEVLGKAYDARLMRRLLAYLRPHSWYVAGALLALIGDAVVQLVPPYLVKVAIDRYIAQGDLAGLNGIASIYLVVLAAAFPLEYTQTYMMQMIGQRIMYDMRMQIYGHLQRLDLSFYDRNPVGRLMTRVTTDVDVINDLFTSGVVAAFGDLFMLTGIMVTLLWMDWRLALDHLLGAAADPGAGAVVPPQRARVVPEGARPHRAHQRVSQRAHQRHGDGAAVPARGGRTTRGSTRINAEHRDANVEQIFYYAVFLPAVEFVAAIATALILWFGGGFVLSGTLTLGSLVAFILYAGRFFRPISDMSEKFNTLQAAMASSERIFQLLDTRWPSKAHSTQAHSLRARSPKPSARSPERPHRFRRRVVCLQRRARASPTSWSTCCATSRSR